MTSIFLAVSILYQGGFKNWCSFEKYLLRKFMFWTTNYKYSFFKKKKKKTKNKKNKSIENL